MQILVKKAKSFHNGAKVLTVGPDMSPQTVPDWVRDTETFRLAAQDGSVLEIQVVQPPAPPAPAPPAPDPAPEPEPVAKKKK